MLKKIDNITRVDTSIKVFYVVYYVLSLFFEVSSALFLFSLVDILMNNNLEYSLKYIAIYAAFIVVMIIVKYMRINTSKKIINMAFTNASIEYINLIPSYGYKKIIEYGSSKIITVMNNNIERMKTFFSNNLDSILYTPTLFIFVSIAIFINDKYTAIIILPVIILSSFINILSGKNMSAYSKEIKDNMEDVISFQNEVVENKENIYLSNADNFLKTRYNEAAKKLYESEVKYTKAHAINYLPSLINEYIPIALYFALSFYNSINKSLDYGIFISNLRLISLISLPFSRLLRQVIGLKSIYPYLKSFIEEFNNNNENINFHTKNFVVNNLHDEQNIISINHLSFHYEQKTIIDNLSFNIKKGDKVAITGNPGCGKTTLLKIITGFIDDYTGSIKFYNNEIKNIDKDKYYKHIGYADNSRIFLNDLYSSIAMDYNYDTKIIEGIIKKLSIKFTNLNNLSGGENMLLNFARILYKNPDIYILDEPVSSSDKEKEIIIMKCLTDTDKTVILTTHRVDTLNEFKNKFNKIIEMGHK